MWDGSIARPYRSLGIRKFFRFAASTVIAVLLLTTLNSQTTSATTDAAWNGGNILYNGNSYVSAGTPQTGSGLAIPDGSPMYTYTEGSAGTQKTHIIYFPPTGEPVAATSASYVVYDFTPPGTYANPSEIKTLSLQASPGGGDLGGKSCDISGGFGWVICPFANAMANAADSIYSVIAWFLTVPPAPTTQDSPIYRAWSIMRTIANLAFVGAFLVIIYSQITGFGLTNYGIKRTLPKLVIAAILVNLSYWISAIGIDLSNIAGYGVQNIFMMLRESIAPPGAGTTAIIGSWRDVVVAATAGATVAVGAGAGLVALGAIGTGVIWYLLPVLATVITSLLVALLVIIVRQALIVLLVIVSPLGFVAMLLPNTEKYFKLWHNTFTTLLMAFPVIGFVFGAAALTGATIINTSGGSIVGIILGMAVQVAPLIITPLLIKFSGGLVSRLTGIVNNPQRGLIDRTRNYSKEHMDLARARNMADRRPGPLRRTAQFLDSRKRTRAADTKNYQQLADNRFRSSPTGERLDNETREIQRQAGVIDTQLNRRHLEGLRADLRLEPQLAQQELQRVQDKIKSQFGELQAGEIPIDLRVGLPADVAARLEAMRIQGHDTAFWVAQEGLRHEGARRHQQSVIATELTNPVSGPALQEYAGGVQGRTGAERVMARALQQQSGDWGEQVKERRAVFDRLNFEHPDILNFLAGNGDLVGTDPNGNQVRLDRNDNAARAAAADIMMTQGSAGDMLRVLQLSGTGDFTNRHLHEEIGARLSAVMGKVPYIAGRNISLIQHGEVEGEAGLDTMATNWLADGKLKNENLAVMPANELRRIQRLLSRGPGTGWSAEKTENFNSIAAGTQSLQNRAKYMLAKENEAQFKNMDAATRLALEEIANGGTLPAPAAYDMPTATGHLRP